jgi:type II secretory pathway predicted ATPase ExeA
LVTACYNLWPSGIGNLFTEDALTLIHTTSRGCSRAVSNLARQALGAAFATGKNLVGEAAARAFVSEVVGG